MFKIKDLIQMEIDIDVYDNINDDLCIAFCGKQELTEKGKEHFADVLMYDVALRNGNSDIIAVVDVDGRDWRRKLKKAKEFFHDAAGYCSPEDWNKWFKA